MLERIKYCVVLLALTFLTGVAGYMILGGSHWSMLDAVYMTAITLTTVGYEEAHDISNNPAARIFTVFLVITGYGVVIYVSSTITAYLVEGELGEYLRRRKMIKAIQALKDHYIVCGGGETGLVVVHELMSTGNPFVLIESDPARVAKLIEHYEGDFKVLQGDATDDEVLLEAGIERAKGLMIVLESDKDILFATLTARQLSRNLRIVAKAVDQRSRDKLLKAGADAVVSSNFIGGMRIASEMLRPKVVNFLDEMLRDSQAAARFEQVEIRAGSAIAGKSIREAALFDKCGVLIIAYRAREADRFLYNPPADTVLAPESVVVILANKETVPGVRALAS
ncbi:MAG: potassium channel protein [Candidatus Wallbacteria bacterium]|nr:potassium channel protein [Candidatus Wallbacteria bacterium]